MNVTQSQNKQSWGIHSLLLTLPFGNVEFTGLSKEQFISINETYSQFTSSADSSLLPRHSKFECRVFRLDKSPAISASALTFDSQYAPRKIRKSDGFELTGINFEAQLSLQTDPVPSYLGVVGEHEFAQANVIENYLRFFAAHKALDQGGVVLHSAGLVFDNQAYIFVGRSGAGKTTLTRKAYQGGAKILSDDINIILPDKGFTTHYAHAVPFTGEFGRTLIHRGGQENFPIAGIFLLEQGDQLMIRSINKSDAIAKLLVGSPFVNTDEFESTLLFDSLTALLRRVPIFKLTSRRDDNIDEIMKAVKDRIVHASINN